FDSSAVPPWNSRRIVEAYRQPGGTSMPEQQRSQYSRVNACAAAGAGTGLALARDVLTLEPLGGEQTACCGVADCGQRATGHVRPVEDRKSTRLNSSHVSI